MGYILKVGEHFVNMDAARWEESVAALVFRVTVYLEGKSYEVNRWFRIEALCVNLRDSWVTCHGRFEILKKERCQIAR